MIPAPEYHLREAVNEDSEDIKNLVFRILKEYSLESDLDTTDSDLIKIHDSYQKKGGYFVVLEKGKKILGCAGIYFLNSSECELRKMYLDPSIRGKGMGRFLLEQMHSKAINLGFSKMRLETASVLKEAVSLYNRYGFKQVRSEHISCRCDQVYVLDLKENSQSIEF
jgi:putative acetyltransferase